MTSRSLMSALSILAVVTVCAATGACSMSAESPRDPRANEAVPGKGLRIMFSDKPVAVPDFRIVDLDGKPIDRTRWAGKVVVLNFWATWCGPCRVEIPDLVALQTRYRDYVVVVGLSVDEIPAVAVKKFALARGISYPVAVVPEQVEDQFGGIKTVPSTFVVNRDGRMVQRHRGLVNAEQLEQEVRSLAGLPTAAQVEIVPDTGQILPANAGR
jgi:thiol-disulfide isomerase/thioredoxin